MSQHRSRRGAAAAALRAGHEAIGAGDFRLAYQELTRAHVLAQPFAALHLRVHWAMLRYARAKGNLREIRGQLIRLLVAAPSSVLGVAPQGNVGWASVSMFQSMGQNPQQPHNREPRQ